MARFLLTVLAVVVGIFMFFICLFFLLVAMGLAAGIGSSFKAPSPYVLTMDLRSGMIDHDAGGGLFGAPAPSVVHTVRALNTAKDDDSIKGLLIRANEYGMTPASAEEVRLAIQDFKSSGKFVVTHSQGFEGTSFTPYLAVSASDEIWQQDTSNFSIAGIRSEIGFYRGVFDKIDAQPQIEQFHEYKSAANVYMETGFTEAHRESTTSMLTSLFDTAVAQIAADRNMTPAQLEAFFQDAPHSAEAALDSGLIDKLGHYLDIEDYVKEKAGGNNVAFKSVQSYEPASNIGSPAIAFVGGQGPVVNGQSSNGANPFSTSLSMGGDTVSQALARAAKDKSVKAIVFRVSTPGGSAVASDQIYNAVARAQEAGKPVVISMGQYAASGGYYVSAGADRIVSMPSTLTGSIGVLGGKVALEDSFAKIGYNVDGVSVGGDYVSAFSGDEPFTEAQQAAYRQQLSDIYDDFTGKVAEGRDMTLEQAREVAKGRVWTGEQAKARGLVDELGGYAKALEIAKELGGIDADQAVQIKIFPRPKTPGEQIEQLLSGTASAQANLEMMREIAEMPEVQALIEARARMQPNQELMADLPELK